MEGQEGSGCGQKKATQGSLQTPLYLVCGDGHIHVVKLHRTTFIHFIVVV